ncbi:hypothetical protein Tfont_02204 [Tepidimonas fonticaldi]|uniref:Uncharacterized protein n=1 Tax=Tepidimonas fonticaldi TaxID=1101373 RepID=A0A554XIM3_9BURK|nr:hypothetical protein [Tepidimonas fonticaldi]TSE35693.1 hypothetical protein Tfont_02204 [Tepidimonas fonticaldi]
MKKLAIAAAAAAAMTAGVAHAYTMGTFSNGFVVPNVIHDGGNVSTAVGVVSTEATSVFWTFFDQDSKHVTDGCFQMTANDYQPFVWLSNSGVGLQNKRGYLVFAAATGTTCGGATTIRPATAQTLAGHAFEYNLSAKDVAYVPVIDGPLGITSGADLTTLGAASVASVGGAAVVGNTLYMRYYIDGAAGGDDTRIVVWSTGNQKGTHTVNIFDDKQNRKSVNFDLSFEELDWFDPETIAGRPADFKDGFIVWNTGNAAPTLAGSVFSYSVISAPAFGAVQTILNPHTR